MRKFTKLLALAALYAQAAWAGIDPQNTFTFGDGASSNKTIRANLSTSTTKPALRYNSAGSVWEFSHDGTAFHTFSQGSTQHTITAQSGTTYTFALTDGFANGNFPVTTFTSASAVTATVPTNASVAFAIGDEIELSQQGTGAVTIAGAGGVTINSQNGSLTLAGQYAFARLVKTATNVWTLSGTTQTSNAFAGSGWDSIATVGNWKVASFTTTGNRTLTVTVGGFVKFFAGAGGGGGAFGGGGGGGIIDHYWADIYLPPGTYTIGVGVGGIASVGISTAPGGNGADTTAFGFTSKGGGGGGGFCGANTLSCGNGSDGGSGGGGGIYNSNVSNLYGSGGLGTFNQPVVQGYAGSQAALSTCHTSGGGGGAGGVGVFVGSCNGGTGGPGYKTMIRGTVGGDQFGGGGGGGQGNSGGSCSGASGVGGAGGGGSGGCAGGSAGTANTGGGAGGCSNANCSGIAAQIGGSGRFDMAWQFQ